MPDSIPYSAAQKSSIRLTDDGEFLDGYSWPEVEPFSSEREAILYRIRALNHQASKKRDLHASSRALRLLMSFTLLLVVALSLLIGFILLGFHVQ